MSRDRDAIFCELLVLRCLRGDLTAPTELVAHFERPLLYYLRRLLPGEADAWDVTQEAWMSVFRALPTLKDPAALPAFLFRTARNAAFAQLRRKRVAIDDATLTDDVHGDESLDDAIFAREASQRLHAALDRLPLAQRDVLTLHFLQDLSVGEIAEVVNIPPGTVKSRIFHAKRALRDLLGGPDESRGET